MFPLSYICTTDSLSDSLEVNYKQIFVTLNAAASTLPQTSEASSSTQQSLVSSPVQEQPAAAQTQELSSRDTIDRPGPPHVRTYKIYMFMY